MKNNQIIKDNRWVAHFDILGFRSMVKNYRDFCIEEELEKAVEEGKRSNIKCNFIFFSDSFIFYTNDDSLQSFYCIEGTASLFFNAMFLRRLPMRGCLNLGDFYANEKNGIFFGQAHIEAYGLAESQKWIGYIISDKAREMLTSFEAETPDIKTGYKEHYTEYEVPFKNERKNMLAYNLILRSTNLSVQNQLCDAFESMKFKAIEMCLNENRKKDIDKEMRRKNEEIVIKYENTGEFLLHVYPDLKDRIEKIKNLHVPYFVL